MTGEDIHQLSITQDINKYKSLFPNVSVAIQIHNNNSGKYPVLSKRYTNSQYKILYGDYGMVRKASLKYFNNSSIVLIIIRYKF